MFVKDVKRRMAGKKAQNVGKHFEYLFEIACKKSGVTCVSIPDGCETRGFNQAMKRPNLIRVKTPFDYIMRHKKDLAFIDTKTVADGTFSYSMQKDHQIEALEDLSNAAHAGLIIWFRACDEVHFYGVHEIKSLREGQSVGPQKTPGIFLGRAHDFDVRNLFV